MFILDKKIISKVLTLAYNYDEQFPYSCGIVSNVISILSYKSGYENVNYIRGYYDGTPHSWVEYDGAYYDFTKNQFSLSNENLPNEEMLDNYIKDIPYNKVQEENRSRYEIESEESGKILATAYDEGLKQFDFLVTVKIIKELEELINDGKWDSDRTD